MQRKSDSAPRIPLNLFHRKHAPRELVRQISQYGNDSFTSQITLEDAKPYLPKLPEGYFYSEASGVLLKVANVHPHTDDAVGDLVDSWVGTVFGVLRSTRGCHLQVGADSVCDLQSGDWVMFDDAVLHSLQASRVILGLSFQIGTRETECEDDLT